MEPWLMVVIALSIASNVAIIKWKLENERYADGTLDALVLLGLTYTFMGTISGLTIGTLASSMFSLYLLISPPKIFQEED